MARPHHTRDKMSPGDNFVAVDFDASVNRRDYTRLSHRAGSFYVGPMYVGLYLVHTNVEVDGDKSHVSATFFSPVHTRLNDLPCSSALIDDIIIVASSCMAAFLFPSAT